MKGGNSRLMFQVGVHTMLLHRGSHHYVSGGCSRWRKAQGMMSWRRAVSTPMFTLMFTLMFQVEDGAGHHELAWQWRLTGALKFLLGPWRQPL